MILTIIVSALNEEQNIETVLSGLENQIDQQGNDIDKGRYNVVVVDNGSTDNTAILAKKFSEQSKLQIAVTYEETQSIITARKTGVREVQENPLYTNTRLLAFCDADITVPAKWIYSILNGFNDSNNHILSYNGSFPHSFWEKVPRLTQRYISEVGTLFFPSKTIKHYGAHKIKVKLSPKIFSDFVRPPSGGFYAIRMETYNSVGGYEREFTNERKEVDGPTWRLYIKLMRAGANLKFIKDIEIQNSERRLLGDPYKFFGIQEYDQLSELRQDFRETYNDQYNYIDNIANSIDLKPVRKYALEYYLLFPCVNRPYLLTQNERYFGSLKTQIKTEICKWRTKNPYPKGFEVFRFCDELTDRYFTELWNEIPTVSQEV